MGDPRNPSDEPHQPLASTLIGEGIQEQVGAVIGPYKLLQKLGEGGMGTVWVADQSEPVKRRVALKLIKVGMDSTLVLRRFEAERQALALMDHQNIAKVLDAGTTPQGRPYFAMELIKGIPITKYCDQEHLTPRERLELFIPVCHAVQHAHQKGVIHRDLKPSKVLVALYEGKPVPKIIDFGVAKATSQRLTERTLYTEVGQIVGTLEYMAPEQAELNNLDIDTRADIYSLGVILYELLVGSPPFTAKQLRGAAFTEMVRMIREVEPQKPSTRLSSSQELPLIAANRKLEPGRLTRLVHGDLDWIVMRALEKDRARRYETANAFAADVLRYLSDEPVEASPPSPAYRLKKLARRYRTALTTATAFVCLLIAAVIVSGWLAFREKAARDAAERNAELAAQSTRLAATEADSARTARLAAEAQKKAADEQREVALLEKRRADVNAAQAEQRRREAERERKEAQVERDRAEAALKRSEWRLYLSQITAAQRDWDSNNVPSALIHLTSCRSDFWGWECRYLYTLFTKNQKTFCGHKKTVTCVAVSPDGKRIASGSWDRTVKVWDVASGREALTLNGHMESVSSVAFSPDGKWIASGGWDGTVKIWDASSGEGTLTLKGHTGGVTGVAFSSDGKRIASGSADNTINLWDVSRGQEVLTLKGHTKGVTCVAYSLDGKRIASGSDDFTVKVWDAASGHETLTLKGYTRVVNCVAFSPDSKRIAVGSWDNAVKVCDASTGQEVVTLTGHTQGVSSVAFSPDGKRIASGSHDYTVKLWDASKGQEIVTLKGHTNPVWSVAFSPDGKWLASGSQDNTVKVWEESGHQDALTLKGHWSSAFSPDSKRIASGSPDNTVKVWDAQSGQEVLTLKGHTNRYGCVAFSPNGERIATGADGTIKVWDAASGRESLTLKGHPLGVWSVVFSPDGKRIACGTRIWNASSGQVTVTLKGHSGLLYREAFSPDGKWIAGSGDKTVKVWDASSGEVTLTLKSGYFAAFSPDSKRVAGVTYDTVKIWDVQSGREILTLKGHTNGVGSVVFSPDGKRIASGSFDGTVKVWDASSGQETFTLKGHTQGVNCVAFSPDGQRIVSGGWDSAIKVWDATTGQETLTLKGHTRQVLSVVFSPDGQRIAGGSEDGTVKIWDASGGQELVNAVQASEFNNDARLLATNPDTRLRDPHRAVELAKKAVESAPLDGSIWNTLGVASYRAGDWKGAESALRKSMNLRDGGDSADWFFLAMLKWRQGENDRARGWYRAAALWMDRTARQRTGSQNDELGRFRTEAAALLGLSDRAASDKTEDAALAAALADARLDSSWSYLWRGWNLAESGQWDCAEQDFTKAIELGPPTSRFWYALALVRLSKDDKPGFQAACADMLRQFDKPGDPETAYFVAWTCALAPQALADLAPTIRLAEHAAHINPRWTQYAQGLGAILYRAGRFDEAVRKLEEVDLLEKQGGTNFSRACTGFFLAMAQRRLNHAAEARKRFDAARDQTAKALKEGEKGSTKLSWTDRITLTLLRQEAEAVVGKQATPASQSAEKLTKAKN